MFRRTVFGQYATFFAHDARFRALKVRSLHASQSRGIGSQHAFRRNGRGRMCTSAPGPWSPAFFKLACDANGLNPILAADSAPLSSVGVGHGTVIWLGNVLTTSPMVSGTASSRQGAKPVVFNTLDQQDFMHPPGKLASTVQGHPN